MSMTPEESYAAATGEYPPGVSAPEPVAAPEPTPDLSAEPVAAPEPAAAPEAPKVNPNWEEAWADVPEPIKAQQRAVFEKWDANYNNLQARHAPYAKFEQSGYNPEYLTQAVEIQQALVEDPQAFVQKVADTFGITLGQAAAAIDEATAGADEEFLTPEEQRIRRLEAAEEARQQQAQQYAEQQRQEQLRDQGVQQIQGALTNLHSKYGDFNEDQVVRWAAMNATTGKNADLEVALTEIRAYEADILQRNARTAPKVLGAAGGTGAFQSPPEPKKILSSDELLAKALALGAQLTQPQ